MKSNVFSIKDISNILNIPITTIRDRIYRLEITPIEIRRVKGLQRYYYSKTQLESLIEYWRLNKHKNNPRKPREPKIDYCLNTNCIIIESKLNYDTEAKIN